MLPTVHYLRVLVIWGTVAAYGVEIVSSQLTGGDIECRGAVHTTQSSLVVNIDLLRFSKGIQTQGIASLPPIIASLGVLYSYSALLAE